MTRGQITTLFGESIWVCRTGEPAGLMGDFKLLGAFPGGTAMGVAPHGAFMGLAAAAA